MQSQLPDWPYASQRCKKMPLQKAHIFFSGGKRTDLYENLESGFSFHRLFLFSEHFLYLVYFFFSSFLSVKAPFDLSFLKRMFFKKSALKRGSLAVETALALPLFFLGMVTLISFMDIYKLHSLYNYKTQHDIVLAVHKHV